MKTPDPTKHRNVLRKRRERKESGHKPAQPVSEPLSAAARPHESTTAPSAYEALPPATQPKSHTVARKKDLRTKSLNVSTLAHNDITLFLEARRSRGDYSINSIGKLTSLALAWYFEQREITGTLPTLEPQSGSTHDKILSVRFPRGSQFEAHIDRLPKSGLAPLVDRIIRTYLLILRDGDPQAITRLEEFCES